jgi:hypothetical protein
MTTKKQATTSASEPAAIAAPAPATLDVDWGALPEDWQTRHPRRTYEDETPRQHANRLRALAEGVPAKRERYLELAEQTESSTT